MGDSKGLVRAPSNASLVGRNTQDKPTDTQKHTTRRAVPACTAQTAVHASQQQLPSGAEGNVHPPAPAHASPSAPERFRVVNLLAITATNSHETALTRGTVIALMATQGRAAGGQLVRTTAGTGL